MTTSIANILQAHYCTIISLFCHYYTSNHLGKPTMASASRSSSIPRNYGSAELNFSAFNFNQLAPQKIQNACPEWQHQQCHSTTLYSETSEDNTNEIDIGLELCYTRSNSSSVDGSSSLDTGSRLPNYGTASSSPRTRGEQDALIEDVIGRLSAYSLTAAREERRVNKKPPLPRTPVSGEDAAIWMRVWGSAHAVKEARTRRKFKGATRTKPM